MFKELLALTIVTIAAIFFYVEAGTQIDPTVQTFSVDNNWNESGTTNNLNENSVLYPSKGESGNWTSLVQNPGNIEDLEINLEGDPTDGDIGYTVNLWSEDRVGYGKKIDGFEDGNYNESPEWEEAAGMNGAFQVTNQTSFEGDYSLNVTAPDNSNSALVYNRTNPQDFSETFTAKLRLTENSPTTGFIVGNTDVYSTGSPNLVDGGFNIGYNLFGNQEIIALVEDENSNLVDSPILVEPGDIPYGEWMQIQVSADKETGEVEARILDEQGDLIGIGDATIPVEDMFLELEQTMMATPSQAGNVSVQYDNVNYDVGEVGEFSQPETTLSSGVFTSSYTENYQLDGNYSYYQVRLDMEETAGNNNQRPFIDSLTVNTSTTGDLNVSDLFLIVVLLGSVLVIKARI